MGVPKSGRCLWPVRLTGLGFRWDLYHLCAHQRAVKLQKQPGGDAQHGHLLQPAGAPDVAACRDPISQSKPVCVV